jgi:hypothetical protein
MKLQTKPVDRWSLVHVGTGVMARGLGVPFVLWLVGSTLYEFVEQGIESKPGNIFATSGPEVPVNAVLDVGFNCLGWLSGRKLLAGKRAAAVAGRRR